MKYFDLHGLSGSHEPVSLDDILRDNAACPPEPEDLETLLTAKPGDEIALDCGGGVTLIYCVEATQ